MRVRSMRERDARAVADLSGQLGYPATAAQIRRRLAMQEKDSDSAALVFEDEEGRIAGWAHVIGRHFLESDPYAELAGLVVDAGARRKGVGRALVTAAEKWAIGRGYATIVCVRTSRGSRHDPSTKGWGSPSPSPSTFIT